MNKFLKSLRLKRKRTYNFTVDCNKYHASSFEAFQLAEQMQLTAEKKNERVIFTPFGNTDQERAEWIAMYFLKLGHNQRQSLITHNS